MSGDQRVSDPDGWARLRFAIIGPLLADPPPPGDLGVRLKALAAKDWRHPVTGLPLRFGFATLERWYYLARDAQDPVAALRRRRRRDAGQQRGLNPQLIEVVRAQYRDHPGWTVQLHYDNLAALVDEDERLGPLPSYATVRRFMKRAGLHRRRVAARRTPGGSSSRRIGIFTSNRLNKNKKSERCSRVVTAYNAFAVWRGKRRPSASRSERCSSSG
jgi:hypothetical protein